MYLYSSNFGYRIPRATLSPPFAGTFGETGSLRRFSQSELILSPDETVAVLQFFWPDKDLRGLGPITDGDREFAQALLLEAVDASCTMGVVESIYRRFFMKVPGSFKSILRSAMKVVGEAVRQRWFKRCRDLNAARAKVYESVRASLARNFPTF